jgi:hypothetical protein
MMRMKEKRDYQNLINCLMELDKAYLKLFDELFDNSYELDVLNEKQSVHLYPLARDLDKLQLHAKVRESIDEIESVIYGPEADYQIVTVNQIDSIESAKAMLPGCMQIGEVAEVTDGANTYIVVKE